MLHESAGFSRQPSFAAQRPQAAAHASTSAPGRHQAKQPRTDQQNRFAAQAADTSTYSCRAPLNAVSLTCVLLSDALEAKLQSSINAETATSSGLKQSNEQIDTLRQKETQLLSEIAILQQEKAAIDDKSVSLCAELGAPICTHGALKFC
jgi:hypothetical protein